MTAKRMLALCAAIVVLCLAMGMMPEEAYAQGDSDSAKAIDKDRASKKGVRNSLASGKDDDDSLNPSKAQMAVGVGSFIVMIIVVKWL